ncbi:hypothetical protein Tco_1121511 [Tanacetum coccineum]|uniref:Uncharacterized protein n=1 Tax=Tanacetum coccineum TaxID=301880 RepID=A0ABQ5IXX0_9ASTR
MHTRDGRQFLEFISVVITEEVAFVDLHILDYGSFSLSRLEVIWKRTEVLVCGTGAITDNNGPQELELDWSGNLRGWTVQYFVNKKVHLVFVTSGIGFTTEEVGIGVLDINSRSGS